MIEVYLNDRDCASFSAADAWAVQNCASYGGVSVSDVSDVSYAFDEIGVYSFGNAADAAFFTLMWRAVK
jgi:hypothetical protein